MGKNDWNPELYLKFDKERSQPSIDLVSRISCDKPDKIVDIGCGPGNSTQILHQRWPEADIVGVDNSPAMIKKASTDYPNQRWLLLDAEKDSMDEKFDIIFSNATIQWIPNHDELIKKFSHLLNDQGVLAVQLPLFFDMPLGKSISEIAKQPKWEAATKGVKELFTIHDACFYYNQLSKHFSKIEIWTTDYYHIMNSHYAILEMIKPTGLKPYLERLENECDQQELERYVFGKIEEDYPKQDDGRVLFPFKRQFFIAEK